MRILLASIYPFAFMLLFVIIPFDDYIRALPNILLIVLTISFPAIIKREHFQKIKKAPLFLLLLFFGYIITNSLISGRFDTDLSILKKQPSQLGLLFYTSRSSMIGRFKRLLFSLPLRPLFSLLLVLYIAPTPMQILSLEIAA